MKLEIHSSAPHIHPAARWRHAAANQDELVLSKSSDGALEAGIRGWQPGKVSFHCQRDMFCYVQGGSAVFHRDTGESIQVVSGTAVHFKQGSRGVLEVFEPLLISV